MHGCLPAVQAACCAALFAFTVPAQGQTLPASAETLQRLVEHALSTGLREVGQFTVENAPDSPHKAFFGTWAVRLENGRLRLMIAVLATFLLVFPLLFATFRSVGRAALVITGIPFAGAGGILALLDRVARVRQPVLPGTAHPGT